MLVFISEVEYAVRLRKPIIPIRVETGFRPDGWLGMASGSKMVIDFSDPETFDIKFEQLIKELFAKGVGKRDRFLFTNHEMKYQSPYLKKIYLNLGAR